MSYQPLPPLGATTQAASLPVVIASNQSAVPVNGTVTTVPSGTTVVSGNVSTTITGTTTIAGNVTSSITGTTAVNIYQVGGVAITLGQAVSASSMPVALASDGVGASSSNPIYQKPVGTTTISGAVTSTPIGTTTVTGTTAISGTVTTAASGTTTIIGVVTSTPSGTTTVTGTTAISGTVTTAASGTTTISGNVTSTPTGTTVVTGTTAISGTVSTAVTNTVTSTITGTVTSAVNLYQVNGAAISLGQTTAASSLPVTLASDGLGSATSKPLYHLGSTAVTNIVTTTPTGTTTVTGTTAISGTVTTAASGTTTITGTVTTSPSGTTTVTGTTAISGTVTTAATGTTTITGTVTSVPSGTTTVSVSNTVTSTITGTTAVNMYQVGGVALTFGQKISSSSMPVVLASDGLGASSTTPLTTIQMPLTKGTQGTTGVMTQSVHDAGRTYISLVLDNVTGITSEALATSTINKGGVTSAATTYQVTAGKTLRLTFLGTSVLNSATTMSASRVRVRHSTSTVNATSAISIANQVSAVAALANSVGTDDTIIPEAVEIPSGSTIGLTHIETATTCVVSANLLGYEY